MRILILSNNYKPELTGPAGYITDLAEYLVSKGEKVTVLTSAPHYPNWKVYSGYKQTFFGRSCENGVEIFRCPIYIPSKPVPLRRIAYDISYTLSALLKGLALKHYDIVYCVSPPLTIGITAEILSKIYRSRFIIHLMDLIPDAAVVLGMLTSRAVIKTLSGIEKHVYSRASGIIAITPGFKNNLLNKGFADPAKIALLPNWVDMEKVGTIADPGVFRSENGYSENDFLIIYAGNIGNKQGLETLVESAKLMESRPEIKFIIVGEGARKERLWRLSYSYSLKNIRFLPLQKDYKFYSMLSAADCFVVTQKTPVVDFCFPSKLLTYCAAGKPAILSVNPQSETAHFVRDSNCGLLVEPENPAALCQGIEKLLVSAELRKSLGENGRKHIVNFYSKNKILQKYHDFIHATAELHR